MPTYFLQGTSSLIFANQCFSSILYVTVYDEDRFGEPEFLGKIGLPVVTFRNETSVNRIVQLRDKSLRQATKGTIELIVHKKWDPLKVSHNLIRLF